MSKQTEALKLALEAFEKLNAEKSYWWQEVEIDTVEALEKAESICKQVMAEQPAQQEPVAKKKHEPTIDLGKYAGTYGGYIKEQK